MMQNFTLLTRYFSFKTAALIIVVIAFVLPILPISLWSVARGWYFPQILPNEFSLAAWSYIFSDVSGVIGAIWMTIWTSSVTTFLAITLGIPAGRVLGLYYFKGKRFIEILIFAPVIIPSLAAAFGLHSVFLKLGLANAPIGVIVVHLIPVLPYVILVMAGVFSNFDRQIEQQARTLGASPWQVWWFVTLPAISPGIMVSALFAFLVSGSQYFLTLLIGGGKVITLPILLFNFATSGRNDIAGAIAVLYCLPGIIILIFTSRFISGRSHSYRQLEIR